LQWLSLGRPLQKSKTNSVIALRAMGTGKRLIGLVAAVRDDNRRTIENLKSPQQSTAGR
jgi:hypothetical protein